MNKARVAQLEPRLAGFPEVRQVRVLQLRRAVSDGRYQISDEQLAEAILADPLAPFLLWESVGVKRHGKITFIPNPPCSRS